MTGKKTHSCGVGRPCGEFNAFLAEHGEIDYLDAIFVDMCGTVRGKRFPSEEADKVFGDGVQMPQSIYFFDVTGVNEDILGMGFSDGDPDAQSHPVAGSIVPVPWASMKQAQVLMTVMVDEDGLPPPAGAAQCAGQRS